MWPVCEASILLGSIVSQVPQGSRYVRDNLFKVNTLNYREVCGGRFCTMICSVLDEIERNVFVMVYW